MCQGRHMWKCDMCGPGACLGDLALEVLSADARARAGRVGAWGGCLGAPAVRLAVQGQEDGLVRDAPPLVPRILPQLRGILQSSCALSHIALNSVQGCQHAGSETLCLASIRPDRPLGGLTWSP